MLENIIIIAVLVLILSAVIFYMCKAKKKGNKCIGCSSCLGCSACAQKNKDLKEFKS